MVWGSNADFYYFFCLNSQYLYYRKHQEETTTDFIFLSPSHRKWCTPLLPWFLVICIADPILTSQETQGKISGPHRSMFVLPVGPLQVINKLCWLLVSDLTAFGESLQGADQLLNSGLQFLLPVSERQQQPSVGSGDWGKEAGGAGQGNRVWPAQNCPSRTLRHQETRALIWRCIWRCENRPHLKLGLLAVLRGTDL